ncbi:MAG TPA: hypothetical protein PK152_00435 [Anaerolineales bacterium]|nr:hypothetical protein [Anaerolineales bacterium]HRK87567.1 hypothetical protein [Anaerolineales bacterium]
MTQPSFLGDWLVSEYVYTPAGEYAGVIHQRRKLQPQGDVIRVIQICEPVKAAHSRSRQAEEVINIMNKRVGEFVFDLKIVGKARHYLGEDVVGGGFSWKDGVLTARGMWTRFGYNFTSFSILLNPGRQVTGGKFFVANEEIATIVGAAVPEGEGFPALEPTTPSGDYQGERYLISPEGELIETIAITANDMTFNETEGRRGRQKLYGALREIEAVTAPGETVSWLEVNDETTGMVAGLCKWNRDEKLHHVHVYLLRKSS